MQYLQSQHIAHCNLTPENVYVVRGDHIKITGFESSKQYFQQELQKQLTSNTHFCSQKSFNIGETLIEKSVGDPFEADIHDVGVIFSAILYGEGPSPSKSNRSGSTEIVPSQARNLLSLMMNRSKDDRVSVA